VDIEFTEEFRLSSLRESNRHLDWGSTFRRVGRTAMSVHAPILHLGAGLFNDAHVPNNDAPAFVEPNPGLRHPSYFAGRIGAVE
jgi:hypothetical protein